MKTFESRIVSYISLSNSHAIDAGLEEIFFEASSVQSFADEAHRTAFRNRWLTSYLELNPEDAFLALDASGFPVGYVIGALENPVDNERYEHQPYYAQLGHLTPRYPAHLHIN